MMNDCCGNCKFYEPIQKRGQRYPRGVCHKHYAYRLSDKYKIHLSITQPYEYKCDLHSRLPQPIYVLVDGEEYLVPPIVADSLIAEGWVRVTFDAKEYLENIITEKGGEINGNTEEEQSKVEQE